MDSCDAFRWTGHYGPATTIGHFRRLQRAILIAIEYTRREIKAHPLSSAVYVMAVIGGVSVLDLLGWL